MSLISLKKRMIPIAFMTGIILISIALLILLFISPIVINFSISMTLLLGVAIVTGVLFGLYFFYQPKRKYDDIIKGQVPMQSKNASLSFLEKSQKKNENIFSFQETFAKVSVELANDLYRLSHLKKGISSIELYNFKCQYPFMNTESFTSHFEKKYPDEMAQLKLYKSDVYEHYLNTHSTLKDSFDKLQSTFQQVAEVSRHELRQWISIKYNELKSKDLKLETLSSFLNQLIKHYENMLRSEIDFGSDYQALNKQFIHIIREMAYNLYQLYYTNPIHPSLNILSLFRKTCTESYINLTSVIALENKLRLTLKGIFDSRDAKSFSLESLDKEVCSLEEDLWNEIKKLEKYCQNEYRSVTFIEVVTCIDNFFDDHPNCIQSIYVNKSLEYLTQLAKIQNKPEKKEEELARFIAHPPSHWKKAKGLIKTYKPWGIYEKRRKKFFDKLLFRIHPIQDLVPFSTSRMEHRYDHPDIQALLQFTNDTCFFIRQHLHYYPSEKMVSILNDALRDLKKHYYTLAKKYHTDKTQERDLQQSKQIFQAINDIYSATEEKLNDILKERVEWIAFVQDMNTFFAEQRKEIDNLHGELQEMEKETNQKFQEMKKEMELMMQRKFKEFTLQLSLQEAPQAETIFRLFPSFPLYPQMFYPLKKIHQATNELLYLVQNYVQSSNHRPLQKRLKAAFHHIKNDYRDLALHYYVHKDHDPDVSLEKEKFALQAIDNIQSPLIDYLQAIKHDPCDNLLKDILAFYQNTHHALKKRITQLELREIGIEMYLTPFKVIKAAKNESSKVNIEQNQMYILG